MSISINEVRLQGNLGADPKGKDLPSGGRVVNAVLATTKSWRDKQTGQRQESTEWHQLVAFNGIGKTLESYARKGKQIYVTGELRTRKYQAADGSDRYATEVVINDLQLGRDPEGVRHGNTQQPQGQYSAP